MRIGGTIENRLLPGRYFVQLLRRRAAAQQGDIALHLLRLLDFVVYGTRHGHGHRVAVDADVEAELEPEPRARERRRRSSCARSAARPRSAAAGGARSTCST